MDEPRNFGFRKRQNGLSENEIAAAVLDFNGYVSEADISSDEDDNFDDTTFTPPIQAEEDSSNSTSEDEPDLAPLPRHTQADGANRRVFWRKSEIFDPLPAAPEFIEPAWVGKAQDPVAYFNRYIGQDIFEQLVACTNQRYLIDTGKNLDTTVEEMQIFFGVTITMSYLGYPRIRMYWENRTRVPCIVEKMSRSRYYLLRKNLKIVNDLLITDDNKKKDKYFKLRPLLNSVRNACLENERSLEVSMDEQMIPFWGHTAMRQFIRGKPNPCGLKMFVSTSPDGLPLDFFMYEGKGDSILPEGHSSQSLGIGGKVIMRLSDSLPEGVKVYMDRYFTSIPLLDAMHAENGIQGTGTLRKSNIPPNSNLKSDKDMAKAGRGSIDQSVRSDGQIAVVKWSDNKPVVLASSVHGANPVDECRRWSKKDRQYIQVPRPDLVRTYNTNMGGVDFLDRVISNYRISARTRKWTIRLIMHMFDFAISAGWIEYRRDQKALNTPKKKVMDHLSFRISIADAMLDPTDPISSEDDAPDDPDFAHRLAHKRNIARVPHPTAAKRGKHALHMPQIPEPPTNNRCRYPGCKSNKARVRCTTCGVFLCLVQGRDCYNMYHKL